jgi:hypothetical protein
MTGSEFKKKRKRVTAVTQQITSRLEDRRSQPPVTSFVTTPTVILLLLLMAIPAWARTKRSAPTPTDPGYLLALSTANRFLLAWQSGDLANGIVLVSDGVRHTQNADKFEEFFSVDSDRAFEIGAGRGSHRRYSFPVVLVTAEGSQLSRHSYFMVLALTGKNDWVVDKLP